MLRELNTTEMEMVSGGYDGGGSGLLHINGGPGISLLTTNGSVDPYYSGTMDAFDMAMQGYDFADFLVGDIQHVNFEVSETNCDTEGSVDPTGMIDGLVEASCGFGNLATDALEAGVKGVINAYIDHVNNMRIGYDPDHQAWGQ